MTTAKEERNYFTSRTISPEEMEDLEKILQEARSYVSASFSNNDMFYSLALLGCCNYEINGKIPAAAAITTYPTLTISIHPDALWYIFKNPGYRRGYFMILYHEIQHILQLADFREMKSILDFSPLTSKLYTEYKELKKTATGQDLIDLKERYTKAFDNLDNPESPLRQRLSQQACNYGMDVCVNESAKNLSPESFKDLIRFFKKEVKIKDPLITMSTFKKMIEISDLEADLDWVFYSQRWIDFYAKQGKDSNKLGSKSGGNLSMPTLKQVEEEMNKSNKGADSNFSGSQSSKNGSNQEVFGDLHDFGEASVENLSENGLREVIQKAFRHAKQMEAQAGKKSSDWNSNSAKYQKLSRALEKVMNNINIRFKRIKLSQFSKRWSYSVINRKMPLSDFPGRRKFRKPKRQVVMVMDTSGSMWCEQLMSQMFSAAKHFYGKGELEKLYCCDTELMEVELTESFMDLKELGVYGGGGTIFGTKQLDRILKDLRIKKGVDIIYCTDEYVYGLEASLSDPRIKLHVVNVPKILQKE